MHRSMRVRLRSRYRVRLPRHLKRIRLEWEPSWQPEIRGWARNFLLENKWRCDPIMGMDDLLQEAYIVFLRVKETYPRVVEPRHFMSLYKTSLRNEVCNFSRESARTSEMRKELFRDMTVFENAVGTDYTSSRMAVLLAMAPPEVRQVLNALHDDSNVAELRAPYRESSGMRRESLNSRLRRLCGIDEPVDLVGSIRIWLTS